MRRPLRVLAAAVVVTVPLLAGAQVVRFSGSTQGCFYSGALASPSASPCTPQSAANLGGAISFTSGNFDVFTAPFGSLGFGAIGSAGGSNSLGVVTSSGTPFSAVPNQYLRLQISFSGPILVADVNGTPSDNVFAVDYLVTGAMMAPGIGGVSFTPVGGLVGNGLVGDPVSPGVLRSGNFYSGGYTNGDVFPPGPGGGTSEGFVYYHTLDTRSVTAGSNATLTSSFLIDTSLSPFATVPEPATTALVATGLVVVAGVARRRRVPNRSA